MAVQDRDRDPAAIAADREFGPVGRFAETAEQMVESIQGRVFAEMSELAGRTRADLEKLKAFLSRTNDNAVRLAYRTDPEEAPRRFVVVGSANEAACLPNDPSENRRWITVPIASRDPQRVRDYLDNWRRQLTGTPGHLSSCPPPDRSEDRLLTRAQVERRVALKRSAIYRLMRAGQFPLPLMVGPTAVRWSAREIEAWIDGRPRSRGWGGAA